MRNADDHCATKRALNYPIRYIGISRDSQYLSPVPTTGAHYGMLSFFLLSSITYRMETLKS
jgi:hypothetical protein